MRPFLAIPFLLAAGLGACLPNPQSVKERRESFARDGIRGELLLDAEPPGMNKVGAVFDRAKLLGYSMDPPQPKAGDRVKINFYWSAEKPMAEDYEVFVHGDPIGGNAPRIHGDHFPARGKYPTDVWRPGEVVVDPFVLWIPPGYGPKKLGVNTGLYKGNYRVPLTENGLKANGGENRSLAIEIEMP